MDYVILTYAIQFLQRYYIQCIFAQKRAITWDGIPEVMTPIELTCDTSVTGFITGHTYIVTDFIATTDEKWLWNMQTYIHITRQYKHIYQVQL